MSIEADEDKPTVLVVDDQTEIRSIFKEYLTPEVAVRTAESAPAALDAMDPSVDMVVLDRNMSGTSGDEFLTTIRGVGHDVPVAIVTAIFPDFDITTLDFDSYLLKPIGRTQLRNAVAAVINRYETGDPIRTYFRILSTLVALESQFSQSELANRDQYQLLQSRLDELAADVRDELDGMDASEIEPLIADFADHGDERIASVLPT